MGQAASWHCQPNPVHYIQRIRMKSRVLSAVLLWVVDLGEDWIAGDDGRVIKNDLDVDRVD
jgi:hypothetical protein